MSVSTSVAATSSYTAFTPLTTYRSVSGCPVPSSRTKTSRPYLSGGRSTGVVPTSSPTQSGSGTATTTGPAQQTGAAPKFSFTAMHALVFGLLLTGTFMM